MATRNLNCTCLTCGKKYHYCINCNGEDWQYAWMRTWDTENCRDIFNTITEAKNDMITKKEAQDRLKKLDQSNVLPSIKAGIKWCFDTSDDTKDKTKAETKVESKAEETKVNTVKPVAQPVANETKHVQSNNKFYTKERKISI